MSSDRGISTPVAANWQDRAACRGVNTDLFYPISYWSLAGRAQAEKALAYCRSCPVRDACRTDAEEHDERFGIWGGLTEEDRGWIPTPAGGRRKRVVT